MVRRPLCILCFIFLTVITLTIWGIPSGYAQKKQQVSAVGEIYYRENGTNSSIFYLKDTYLKDGSYSGEPQNLIIYLSKNIDYPIGTILKVEGTLFPLEAASNPGQFDARMHYRAKGVSGRIAASNAQVLREGPMHLGGKWKEQLLGWRDRWCIRLQRLFGAEAAGVLQAMLFGVTTEIPEELEESYQLLGVGHLLTISGLHITMLGGALYTGVHRWGLPFWAAAVVASFCLLSYQEMLGFRSSALRAAGMFFMFLGAQVTGRAYDRLTALTFVAACLVWYQPMLVMTGGFWLSVAATFGAAIGIERKEEKRRCEKAGVSGGYQLRGSHTVPGKSIQQEAKVIWDCISVVFYIQIFTLPVQLYFYYELAMYGIFWNLLLVPVAGLVLFSGILALVMSYLSYPLGVFAGGIAETVLRGYQLAGNIGEALPGAVYVCGKPEIWQIAMYYVLLAGWMYLGWPREQVMSGRKKGIGDRGQKLCYRLAGLLFFGAMLSVVFLRFHAPLEVSFLDVGQGDCAVIREEDGLCVLVDGGSSDVDHVWKYRIYPFLKHEKISCLDYVFASHGDMDHISGLLEMFEQNRISARYLVCYSGAGEKLDELKRVAAMRGTRLIELSAGHGLQSEMMRMTCLGPERNKSGQLSENDQSLVLLLESEGVRFLFTGDMEMMEERSILRGELADELEADVLKVAHHGSSGASSEVLLERVSPLLSVISCGENNVYGHPHEETLERLKENGSEILVTAECGAITMRVEDGKMKVQRWKTD